MPASIHKSMACARRVQSGVAYPTGRFSGTPAAVATGDLRTAPPVTMLRREAMFGRVGKFVPHGGGIARIAHLVMYESLAVMPREGRGIQL